MAKPQNILTVLLWGCLAVVMIGVVALGLLPRGDRKVDLPELFDAPKFALMDENGKAFESGQLHGRPWIAAFFFTRCAGVCPMMSTKMSDLQKRISDPSVHLVSFSLDPENDTPAVLKEYAARFSADESRWHFVTGTKPQMFEICRGMNLAAAPADPANPIIHSDRFLLVDPAGKVRGIYDSNDVDSMKKLAKDAAALVRTGGASR